MDRAACERLDQECPLAHCRERFSLPEGVLYFDGNSLGALPRTTAGDIDRVVREEWGQGLIESWLDAGWFYLAREAGDAIAPLIGASEGEVIVADSTSVNLFKLAAALLRQSEGRRTIVTERGNFPTNIYILEGLVDLFETRFRSLPRRAWGHYRVGRRADRARRPHPRELQDGRHARHGGDHRAL